jgi:hypothetical protein
MLEGIIITVIILIVWGKLVQRADKVEMKLNSISTHYGLTLEQTKELLIKINEHNKTNNTRINTEEEIRNFIETHSIK